jgi:hypothetical protein
LEKSQNPSISSNHLAEARSLVENAQSESITLRILGGLAVRLHCQDFLNLHQNLGREIQFADMDAITLTEDRKKLEPFFKQNGFNPEPRMRRTPAIWAYRNVYVRPDSKSSIDVFFDRLEMSHTIDLRKRLTVDSPTIPLADLLLAKMQIHEINEKDVKDAIVLIRAHEISNNDQESINERYIAQLMSQDWGFYHTVAINFNKTKLLLNDYKIDDTDKNDVLSKVDRLVNTIEKEPKSSTFRLRARIGEKKKWYNEVDETVRDVLEWH